MLNDSKYTAAIYVRVSTEEQATEGQSIPAQIDTLTQFCSLYQIKLYKTYMDLGLSGKDAKSRPGLMELMQDSRLGLFNMVIVWKISRLTRSLKDLLEILEVFESNSIVFSSYSEKFDTSTPVGRMTLQLLGSIAEFERNTIVENVKLGLREYLRKGGRTGSVYGYDSKDKSLVINAYEAKAVKSMFDMFVNELLKPEKIAKIINSQGFRTKKGNSFNKEGVAYILSNPVYIGVNRYKEQNGTYTEVHGGHPPIIDETTWKKARAMSEKGNGKTSCCTTKQKPLLSGVFLCPQCKHAMKIFYATSKGRKYRYYRCSSCTGVMQNADRAEELLIEHMVEAVLDSLIFYDLCNMVKAIQPDPLERERCTPLPKHLSYDGMDEIMQHYTALFNSILKNCSHEERRGLIKAMFKSAAIHKNKLLSVEYLFMVQKKPKL